MNDFQKIRGVLNRELDRGEDFMSDAETEALEALDRLEKLLAGPQPDVGIAPLWTACERVALIYRAAYPEFVKEVTSGLEIPEHPTREDIMEASILLGLVLREAVLGALLTATP